MRCMRPKAGNSATSVLSAVLLTVPVADRPERGKIHKVNQVVADVQNVFPILQNEATQRPHLAA